MRREIRCSLPDAKSWASPSRCHTGYPAQWASEAESRAGTMRAEWPAGACSARLWPKSCELARLFRYTISAANAAAPVCDTSEIRALVDELSKITKQEKEPLHTAAGNSGMPRNDCRGLTVAVRIVVSPVAAAIMEAQTLLPTLENWLQVVRAQGIALGAGMGEVMPTYFYYDVAYPKSRQ